MRKEKRLSEKETRRLEGFKQIRQEMREDGYNEQKLLIDMKLASALALFLFVLLILGLIYFYMKSNNLEVFSTSKAMELINKLVFFWGLYFLLIIAHELIHGITWAIFAERGFKSIEFGIMWHYGAVYCTCREALPKGAYIIGALMPLILLGIVPFIVGLSLGSFMLALLGIFLIVGAVGDMMIAHKLTRYKCNSDDFYIFDHPTEPGCVVFEK